MKHIQKLITILLVFTVLLSCKNTSKKETADNSYTITVTGQEHFPEGARVTIYRSKTIEAPQPIEFLKTEPFKDGKFVLKGTVNHIHNVMLDVLQPDSDYPYHRVSFPLEPGDITIDFTAQKKFNFKGGHYGNIIVNALNDNKDYKVAWNALISHKTDYDDKASKVEYFELNDKVNNLKQELLGKVIKDTKDPLVKLLAYDAGYFGDKRIDRNTVMEGLAKEVGLDHRQSKVSMLIVKSSRENATARATVGIGSVIKNFEAKNLKGETFHLANVLKENKYVLVEFWASWCGPCRAEIPHMKKAYSHFKDKGFEIVSFTLDDKRARWEKASKEEQIPWIDTGDLLAYTSPVVKMYGVAGVPANYLVEAATGKIIAKDLRQEKLDNKLEELLEGS